MGVNLANVFKAGQQRGRPQHEARASVVEGFGQAVADGAAQHAQQAGVGAALPTLDSVSDAVAQLAIVQAYFAVVIAGGNPTASQLAAAQTALGALGADLRALQLSPEPPPGSKMWVSGTAAAGLAGAAAVMGGVVGWFAKGAAKGKGRTT